MCLRKANEHGECILNDELANRRSVLIPPTPSAVDDQSPTNPSWMATSTPVKLGGLQKTMVLTFRRTIITLFNRMQTLIGASPITVSVIIMSFADIPNETNFSTICAMEIHWLRPLLSLCVLRNECSKNAIDGYYFQPLVNSQFVCCIAAVLLSVITASGTAIEKGE